MPAIVGIDQQHWKHGLCMSCLSDNSTFAQSLSPRSLCKYVTLSEAYWNFDIFEARVEALHEEMIICKAPRPCQGPLNTCMYAVCKWLPQQPGIFLLILSLVFSNQPKHKQCIVTRPQACRQPTASCPKDGKLACACSTLSAREFPELRERGWEECDLGLWAVVANPQIAQTEKLQVAMAPTAQTYSNIVYHVCCTQ